MKTLPLLFSILCGLAASVHAETAAPEKLVFVKRYTYNSSHFYTDFIDGVERFGGNPCILDVKSGKVTDLLPQMRHGIFGRFDLSFDAKRIVFDWKKAPREGFRIYEVAVDGSRLRQLTFRPDDEDARIAKYDNSQNGGTARMYYHQTDDMHPCYLPDGGIIFTSSRCEFGTLCDGPDHLSSAILHRMDGDGRNGVRTATQRRFPCEPADRAGPQGLPWQRVRTAAGRLRQAGHLGRRECGLLRVLLGEAPDRASRPSEFPPRADVRTSLEHGRTVAGQAAMILRSVVGFCPQRARSTVCSTAFRWQSPSMACRDTPYSGCSRYYEQRIVETQTGFMVGDAHPTWWMRQDL